MKFTMSHCNHITQMLSDYHDGSLSDKSRREVGEHLAHCESCSKAGADLIRAVGLLNHLPMPEPRLDLWLEFAPKMLAVEEEQRMNVVSRLQSGWRHTMAHVAEGMVLFTHVIAHRTLAKMEKYLIRDPFRAME